MEGMAEETAVERTREATDTKGVDEESSGRFREQRRNAYKVSTRTPPRAQLTFHHNAVVGPVMVANVSRKEIRDGANDTLGRRVLLARARDPVS